jgi:hypothetical protein
MASSQGECHGSTRPLLSCKTNLQHFFVGTGCLGCERFQGLEADSWVPGEAGILWFRRGGGGLGEGDGSVGAAWGLELALW